MLRLAECVLTFSEAIKVHPEMGSVFHGAVMERISADSAELYHHMTLRPYSQAVYWDAERRLPVWRLGFLTDEAYERIFQPISSCHSLHLKQKGIDVQLGKFTIIKETDYEKLAKQYIRQETVPGGAVWHIRTVMSFKKDGRYVILPDIRLIYQSLLQRWNTFSPETRLEEDGLLDQMMNHCQLTRYQLRSQTFSVNGSTIYGCSGQMHYRFLGFDMLKRIQGILTAFAPYAGVGVKTALGMGSVNTTID